MSVMPKTGAVVFGKVRGHSFWPAVVLDKSEWQLAHLPSEGKVVVYFVGADNDRFGAVNADGDVVAFVSGFETPRVRLALQKARPKLLRATICAARALREVACVDAAVPTSIDELAEWCLYNGSRLNTQLIEQDGWINDEMRGWHLRAEASQHAASAAAQPPTSLRAPADSTELRRRRLQRSLPADCSPTTIRRTQADALRSSSAGNAKRRSLSQTMKERQATPSKRQRAVKREVDAQANGAAPPPLALATCSVNLSAAESEAPTTRCSLCPYESPFAGDLRRHLDNHKEYRTECQHCSFSCPSAEELAEHQKLHFRPI